MQEIRELNKNNILIVDKVFVDFYISDYSVMIGNPEVAHHKMNVSADCLSGN